MCNFLLSSKVNNLTDLLDLEHIVISLSKLLPFCKEQSVYSQGTN